MSAGTVARGGTADFLDVRFEAAGQLVDPDNPLVDITDPSDVAVITDAVPTRLSLGHFKYPFSPALDAPLGTWGIHWTGTISGAFVEGSETFVVAEAGEVSFTPPAFLPSFAALADLSARAPGGISEVDEGRAQAALDDASTKIRAEAGKTWVTEAGDLDLPTGADRWRADILVTVCVQAALRAFTNPEAMTQEGIGTYSASWSNATTDVYLTRAERQMVRRAAGVSGLWRLAIGQDTTQAVEYLDVEPSGEPIPWARTDGF
jgi:hypothetical protein